jgi:hypothetical protein
MCARKFGWGLSSTARDCRRMVHDVYLCRSGRISESGDAGSGKIDVSIVGMVGRLKCGDAVNETNDFFAKISRRLTHPNSTGSRRLVRTRRWAPRRARAIHRSGSHPDAGTRLDSHSHQVGREWHQRCYVPPCASLESMLHLLNLGALVSESAVQRVHASPADMATAEYIASRSRRDLRSRTCP